MSAFLTWTLLVFCYFLQGVGEGASSSTPRKNEQEKAIMQLNAGTE